MRERIDVSEIEAQTKIRAKYLRALENEEWSLLPGPTFVKSFLRTYAQALGLDGKALVEEYRLAHERPSDAMLEPIISTPQSNRNRGRGRPPGNGPSRAYMLTLGAVAAVIVVLIVLLLIGGGGSSNKPKATGVASVAPPRTHTAKHHTTSKRSRASTPSSTTVTLSLRASGVVNVCLIGDAGRKLIAGVNLQPGESTPTFHAKRFELTLGNSAVTMFVDGVSRTVPPSSQAIGYAITKSRGRQPLSASQQPTCQ
jgi:cytoskeleton protein RodZ